MSYEGGGVILILWSKQGVSVRKLEAGDADHLVRWLSDPRVLEYYEGRDRPHDMAMVQEHFYRDDQIEACIIQLDDRDIGYIQYYPVDPEEREVYGYGEGDGRRADFRHGSVYRGARLLEPGNRLKADSRHGFLSNQHASSR
ncbi:GNAT family N-acetyltransferase [Paenibacillus sp. AR247]|uniref:GNAT family N-acetyltransferase n=1 Tax=Paenibacillus sp. AR247 TaxID=1631599 RepID=UPI00280AD7E9|nr:GNAT family N-acetyltransferase [Paenibacillus sp. AR247]